MEYINFEENIPPPLDDVSSAGGTDDYEEDEDLEVNIYSSHHDMSEVSPPKHYKSFQPVIKLQPTDLIYREENSRAAPRKGIDPQAFLTIGEKKEERMEYVGRHKHTGTAPNRTGGERKNVPGSPPKRYSQRQPSTSAPAAGVRNKSGNSRATSGRGGGRHSGFTTPGYTPLPVAPPVAPPTRENTYVSRPFKQDLSHDIERFEANRRPVSPGADMKQATMLATMEVGRFINQREKTPKIPKPHEPRLLKARLKPLNTVNVQGPSIYHCQGVQPDQRKFGPSVMKTKQQQRLDNMIQKNAAIKDLPGSTLSSRIGSAKQENSRKSAGSTKSVRIKSGHSDVPSQKEPTPSPRTSTTKTDQLHNEPSNNSNGHEEKTSNPFDQEIQEATQNQSRPISAAPSEASQTSQQAMARSVSVVTIRHRESTTPDARSSKPTSAKHSVVASSAGKKGLIFITDADSTLNTSRKNSANKGNNKQSGCKDFTEESQRKTEHDDEGNPQTQNPDPASHPAQNSAKTEPSGKQGETTNQQNQSSQPDQGGKEVSIHSRSNGEQQNSLQLQTQSSAYVATQSINWQTTPEHKQRRKTSKPKRAMSAKQRKQKEYIEQVENHSTFITAGFLSLESMISDARSELRRSYSFNDLDQSCNWNEPISQSPRSIEVLPKGVTFADEDERYYYDNSVTREAITDLYQPEHMQLMLYETEDISNEHNENPLISKLDLTESISDDKLTGGLKMEREKIPIKLKSKQVIEEQKPRTCLDSIQRELAARDTASGVHGEISEYITTKPTTRQIYPPANKKPNRPCEANKNKTVNVPTLMSDSPLCSYSEFETESDILPPPPTPCIYEDEGFGSVESGTPSEAGDKCFLETLVDLMPPETIKSYVGQDDKESSDMSLPGTLEGQTKPMKTRDNPGIVEPVASLAPACFKVTALPPRGSVFYFAYNADMNTERFSALLGRKVEEKRWGLLMGFQLVFNKQGLDPEAGLFPNIEANPYTSTEGAVYTISHDELATVDGYHGFPDHYARVIIPTWVCNSDNPDEYNIAQYCVPAVTYVAQDVWLRCDLDSPTKASKEYNLRQCVKGSDGLTEGYKTHLSSMLQECV